MHQEIWSCQARAKRAISRGTAHREFAVIRYLAVRVLGGFVFGEAGTDVIQRDMVCAHSDAHMPGVAQKHPLFVAVGGKVANAVVAGKTRLGDHQVNDPVEFLEGVKIIVGLKDRGDVVTQQQGMHRLRPVGAV